MLMQAAPVSDPVFPALANALDSETAASAFRAVLFAIGYPVDTLSCAIERCRIKRGRKALIGYRLTGRTIKGEAFDQRVMLALFPGKCPAALPVLPGPTELSRPGFGPSVCSVEPLGGKAWFFPNDRKIAHLADLIAEPGTQVIHYVPEQGCTVRRVRADGMTLYGKCRADDRGSVAAKVASLANGPNSKLRMARLVSHDPDRRILWQEAVAGNPAPAEIIWSDPSGWACRMAEAISDFQSLPPPAGLKQLTFTSIAAAISARIARMQAALPGMADRLQAFGSAWQASLPGAQPPVLAHGDLHSGNLLWDGTSFALIDLDTAALAPQAADFGTLTAALVHKAIEAGQPEALIDQLANAFESAARSVGCDGASFNWCLAASLIGERLYRCTTRLKSPSLQVRERLLAFAERRMSRHA